MFYVVQENVFREENYDILVNALNKIGLEYIVVRVPPFIDKIVDVDDIDKEIVIDRKDVFVFGSLKMAKIARQYGWQPGSLMTPNHDFNVYKEHYKTNLLNYHSGIYKFGEDFQMDKPFFARPCLDTKTFTGKVFDKETWLEFRNNALTNGHSTILDANTEIQVTSVKKIQKEFRMWIVDGKIVSGSLYRLNGTMMTSELLDEEAIGFTKRMLKIFQLAPAFIMDVCLTDNQWKIVECGCINCAGFYKTDMAKVLMALENFYAI